MKKILLLATGGTIASVEGNDGLSPGLQAHEIIQYIEEQPQDYIIESHMLMNIDSTNMQPEDWVRIAQAIHTHYANYDGFVITHGTDTMAYTAAALSYILQNLQKPVVLTGSQIPISFKKTDARKNIKDALLFATEDIGGVFVVFDGRVMIGTRAVKMRTKSYDAFESINYPYVATIKGNDITYNFNLPKQQNQPIVFDPSICPDVFLMKLHPGAKPEIFDYLKPLYRGVIIESFGSGGVPFQKRNLLPKVKELTDANIAVVITTQCLEEGENVTLYEVGRKVTEHLIILSGDMNTEAIVPKLMWALGKTNDLLKVKELMETPIFYDLSLEKSSYRA